MTSKKVNDQKINKLAVGVSNGCGQAQSEFAEEIMPHLESFANRVYCVYEKEDKVQEFMLKAYEIALEYQDKYQGQNIMPIIYQSCKNVANNINKAERGTEKRGKYDNRTKSMNDVLGGEGDNADRSISDMMTDNSLSTTEEIALGNVSTNEILKEIHIWQQSANKKYAHIIQCFMDKKSNLEIARDINDLFEKNPIPVDEVEYNEGCRSAVRYARKSLAKHLKSVFPEIFTNVFQNKKKFATV